MKSILSRTLRRRGVDRWTRAAALAVSAAACDDERPDIAVIDKTRILAARVEVEGDPARASPAPGETVSVSLLVVTPDPDPALAYALQACVATDSVSDLVSCTGEPLALASSLEPVVGVPVVSFSAPEGPVPSGRLAVIGAVCSAGVALPAENARACADGSWLLGVTADFPMQDETTNNLNPAFVSLSLDGAELSAETASENDCGRLPGVPSASTGHGLRAELDPESRDPLPQVASSDPPRESLLVSWFTNRGELDHAYSSIDSDAPDTLAVATWDAPSVGVPTLARFFVVVRDGRGGSDFLERRACVVP
ncbi:MAG TPA: hypothetical protein VGK73_02795 [Polyangiaceae bacterium]